MRILAMSFLTAACLLAQSNPLTQAVTTRYTSAKQYLIGSAQLMPESDYAFKLSASQRPFSEWIQHTAMGNYGFCSAIGGGARPDISKIHDATKKDDLVAALKQSFDYCDDGPEEHGRRQGASGNRRQVSRERHGRLNRVAQ